jgi:hypothetical protein
MRRAGWCLVGAVVLIAAGCGAVPPTSQVASPSRTSTPTPAFVACAGMAKSTAYLYGAVYLRNQNAVLLFGGDWATQSRVAETWQQSSEGCLTKLNPAASPSLRDSMAMAYDPARGVVVMYGGRVGGPGESGKFIFDTWTWEGQTWKAVPTTGPEMRNPAAAYDPLSKRVILFGASERGEAQTWAWTGERWQLLSPAVSPSGRTAVSFAFDSATGQLLLFGGAQTFGPVGETWTWNGSTWQQIVPNLSPSPRLGAAMGPNGVTPGLVLYGGSDFSHPHTDTWIWDGRRWTQADPGHVPLSGLGGVSVATDAGLEMIGRTNAEVWRWSGKDWVRLA